MRFSRFVFLTLAFSLPLRALAESPRTVDVPKELREIRQEPRFTFCSEPKRPLLFRQTRLCSLAEEAQACDGFKAACSDTSAPKEEGNQSLAEFLGAVGKVFIWFIILAIAIGLVVTLGSIVLRARRDKQLASASPAPKNIAKSQPEATSPDPTTDAESALMAANECARSGDFKRALSLYLAASLASLDRRGAIRLARSRTHGEYVRLCTDHDAQASLREIVREVDKVHFGNVSPTAEGVAHVEAQALRIVRARRAATSPVAITTLILLVLVCMGCGIFHDRSRKADDPAGDELPMELLRKSGYSPSYLGTSIAALPIPEDTASAPVVIVDVDRVSLEDEAQAHLLRWVEAGGVLMLFGDDARWPSDLHVESKASKTRGFEFRMPIAAFEGSPKESEASEDGEEIADEAGFSDGDDGSGDGRNESNEDIVFHGMAATPRAFLWDGATSLATSDKDSYAASKRVGKGAVIGIAGNELITNVGVVTAQNAEILVGLVNVAFRAPASSNLHRKSHDGVTTFDLQIAREQDGVSPPSNPFSALSQAGLDTASWHALVAALVLFLAVGIRHARPAPTPSPGRRAFAEHVEATGAFYGRTRALAHALSAYGRFAEMRVREKLTHGMDPITFLATRTSVPHAEVARIWRRATDAEAEDSPRGDELATIRDLRALLVKAMTAKS